MRDHSLSPLALASGFWRHRELIRVLVVREVAGRYRGSMLGILWSFFNPVFMLAVYTFVFSVVFRARWAGGSESKAEFALVLFAGLLVFNLFSECIGRAPGLIVGNVNYVKKVVFPLEIFPLVTLGAALFHTLASLAVWLLFSLFVLGMPQASMLLFPLVLAPLLFFILGLSWFLASLGVFLRDVGQIVGILITTLMFLTPIFYPLAAIPERYRPWLYFNPLTFLVEQTRNVLVFGKGISWGGYAFFSCAAVSVAWLGFAWFQKTRKGFADVL